VTIFCREWYTVAVKNDTETIVRHKMSKTHVGTYRPGPYIFIEEARVLVDENGEIYVKARYREHNEITVKGMVRAINRSRTFKVDFNNRCLLYKGEVFPTKNLGEILKFIEELCLHNGIRCDVADL